LVTETKSAVFYCDVCGAKHLTKEDAERCEAKHRESKQQDSKQSDEMPISDYE